MGVATKQPVDIVRRLAERASRPQSLRQEDGWRRESFTLDRAAARAKARECFELYPKAAYMTEVEFWRELEDGRIEFTIRRLPTAD